MKAARDLAGLLPLERGVTSRLSIGAQKPDRITGHRLCCSWAAPR